MKTSTDRILTTHVGSLPRPQDVVDFLFAEDRGDACDATQMETAIRTAVEGIIQSQKDAGVDIPSDGEMSKISYATYIRHRLTGFEGDSKRPTPQDLDDFPDYRDKLVKEGHSATYKRPACKGDIKVKNLEPVKQDIARHKAALAKFGYSEGFMNAVSPGTVAVFQPNEYYKTTQEYLFAVAEAMRHEYELIANSGLLLQLDCPDLAMGRHSGFKHLTEDQFLKQAEIQVEALNHAVQNIPSDRMRLHICWGNYEGPHTHDIPLAKVLPILLKAKPGAYLIEGANPCHEHEWELWKSAKLPEGKILIPGVLDTSCNFVEHPQLVCQRILRYAESLGRDRVIAGTDCGFGTFAGFGPVHPSICWMKLKSLAEGARLASAKLWGKASAN